MHGRSGKPGRSVFKAGFKYDACTQCAHQLIS